MNIGVPKEIPMTAHRVGMTPRGVLRLVARGHTVYVEHDAGMGSKFSDEDYDQAGARIVFSSEEVYGRSDLVVRVQAPPLEDYEKMKPGQIILAFLHLAVAQEEIIKAIQEKQLTMIGYEIIEERDGSLPVLLAMSELAGQMCIHIAAHYLESTAGGRGIVLGGAPGIPPATVVILGAGTLGSQAARTAVGCGAHVVVLDHDTKRLRTLEEVLNRQVVTGMADRPTITKAVGYADVLIGAVLGYGGIRTPHLVTESMVETMKPGAVIIDASIDQGGCIETARPTTLDKPTYLHKEIIHYCVPNMTANVARTATRALGNAGIPYIRDIAERGLAEAVIRNPRLGRGVYFYRGACLKNSVSELFGLETETLDACLSRDKKENE